MSAATKSALLLVMTLLVGLLLGFVGAGTLERQRRGPRLDGPPPRDGGGIARHMEDVIEPRDSAQASQVRPILERTAMRNREIIRAVNQHLRASVDSMKSELAPVLDEQQRDRVEHATGQLPAVGLPGQAGPGRGGRGRPEDRDPNHGPPPPDAPPPSV